MLDFRHLRHGVSQRNNLWRATPSGDHHMNMTWAILQSGEHIIQCHPAVDQWIGQLIEYDHEVFATHDGLLGLLPAIAR